MNIGKLTEHVDPQTRRKSYSGEVRLIGLLTGDLSIVPHPNFVPGKSADTHPQFLVEYRPRTERQFYELGAAWQKKLRQSDGEFISITLDMPQWERPLNLAMYAPDKERGESEWRLQWSRPRGGEQEQAAA